MDFAPPKTAPQHRDRCDTEIELTRWAAADEANDMGLRRLVVYTCFDQARRAARALPRAPTLPRATRARSEIFMYRS